MRHTATTRRTSRCGSPVSAGSHHARWRRRSPRRSAPYRASSESRWQAPASSTSSSATSGTRRRCRSSSPQATASAPAPRRRRSACRWSWSPPTRQARSRSRPPATARTATPWRGCSPSPATRSSASTTATTRARRSIASAPPWTQCGAARSHPKTGTTGLTSPSSPRRRATRCRGCWRRSKRRSQRFRIRFDTIERQSEVETEVEQTLPLLDTYEDDGALWARTSAHGDDKDRVLVRSNGAPTYFAVDAAYVRRKYARGFDRLVYVLGADHHGYVARLQALAEMLGHPRGSLEVLLYQLVHLVKGGEATKMAKRRGDVVFLDEFVDEIGVDAARWYLVSRGHDQTIEIDVDVAAEKTQKNPVYYVQYAHARIAGILAQGRERPGDAEQRAHTIGAARGRGAGPAQAPAGLPAGRRRGGGPARTPRDPDLCDPRRRRLPPLLPPPQGARLRAGGDPPRPVPGDQAGRGPLPGSRRHRRARPDVTPSRG